MTAPKRVRLSRAKGWRLPKGAVKVDRTTRWGNPYRVEKATEGWKVVGEGKVSWGTNQPWSKSEAAAWAVAEFREWIRPGSVRARDAEIQLGGKDLACWCPLDEPCHADVLLEIANRADGRIGS